MNHQKTFNKNDERIYNIILSLGTNADELNVSINSLLSHIHALGITGTESDEKIRKAVKSVLSILKENSEHLSGAVTDIKKIGEIINNILK